MKSRGVPRRTASKPGAACCSLVVQLGAVGVGRPPPQRGASAQPVACIRQDNTSSPTYPHRAQRSALDPHWQGRGGAARLAAARLAVAAARALASTVGCPRNPFFSLLCTPVVLTCPWLPRTSQRLNKRLPHFRSLSVPSTLPCTPLCPLPVTPTPVPPTSLDLRSRSPRH
jgi:hypothetical protein